VHFLADDEIFGHVEFHYEILAKRLRELSFLNNGVSIKLVDQRAGKEELFAFAGGVQSFVEYINRTKSVLHPTIFYSAGEAKVGQGAAIPASPSASKWPCSGTIPIRNRCSASPTTSRNPTAAPT
jgi:DNA gyrase subunit B